MSESLENTYNKNLQLGDTVKYEFYDNDDWTRTYCCPDVVFMAYSEFNEESNLYDKAKVVTRRESNYFFLGKGVKIISSKTVLIEKIDLLMMKAIEKAGEKYKWERNYD